MCVGNPSRLKHFDPSATRTPSGLGMSDAPRESHV